MPTYNRPNHPEISHLRYRGEKPAEIALSGYRGSVLELIRSILDVMRVFIGSRSDTALEVLARRPKTQPEEFSRELDDGGSNSS